jgi:hypothetical protein
MVRLLRSEMKENGRGHKFPWPDVYEEAAKRLKMTSGAVRNGYARTNKFIKALREWPRSKWIFLSPTSVMIIPPPKSKLV